MRHQAQRHILQTVRELKALLAQQVTELGQTVTEESLTSFSGSSS